MPGRPVFDARAYGIRRVSRAMEDLLLRSTTPIPYGDQRVLLSWCTDNPNFTAKWLARADEQRYAGQLYDPVFQQGLRNAIWKEWVRISRNPTTPDTIFNNLDSHFYPTAGVESYLLRNPYCFIKDSVIAGTTTVYHGPKGSGKTEYAALDMFQIKKLKADHLALGSESPFAQLYRGAYRFFTPLAQLTETPAEPKPPENEEEPVPANEIAGVVGGAPPEPRKVAPKPTKKLDLYHAKGVRFPTNMTIPKKGPFAQDIQFGGRISDVVLDAIDNDMTEVFSRFVIDEFGAAANKRRGNTTANWIILQFVQTHRKLRASLGVVAQSAERQIPTELLEEAQTRVEKLDVNSPGEALVTVSGLFQEQRFRDIPKAPVSPDTQASASFAPDITLTVVWAAVAALQRATLDAGEEWTHLDELLAAKKFILENRASPQEIAEGKNGILRSEIRMKLREMDPMTGKPYTPQRVARLFAEELEQDAKTEVLPIVLQVVEAMKKEATDRRDGTPPPTAEEILDAAEEDAEASKEIEAEVDPEPVEEGQDSDGDRP